MLLDAMLSSVILNALREEIPSALINCDNDTKLKDAN